MRNWGIAQTCIRRALPFHLNLLVTVTTSDNWRDKIFIRLHQSNSRTGNNSFN